MTKKNRPTRNRPLTISPTRRPGRYSLGAVLASVMTLLLASNVYGRTFAPVKPTVCPTYTQLAFDFSVGYGSNPWEEAGVDPGTGNTYPNNVDQHRYFLANPWSSQADFRISAFQTEAGYDKLIFYSGGTQHAAWSGSPTLPSYEEINVGSNLETRLRWLTDINDSRQGFQIDQVGVCTNRTYATTDSGIWLDSERRSMGVLLGTSDVAYARMILPYGITHASFYLWGTPQTGESADFDLYVRCGEKPTASAFTSSGETGTNNEFIDVECPSGTTVVYIAVNSYSGRGTFNLLASPHKTSQHRTLTAAANFVPTAQQWSDWTDTLTWGVRRFYGVTEGAIIIDKIQIFKSGTNCDTACNGPCTFCLQNDFSGADSWVCNPQGRIRWGVDVIQRAQAVAHELGHLLYCNEDEYRSPDGASCGHTIMDTEMWYNNNVCRALDHNKDKFPPRTTDAQYGPGTIEAYNAGVTITYYDSETPDNTFFYEKMFYNSNLNKHYFYAAE